MKILFLFLGALVLLIAVAHALGWKNLGNTDPVTANKIALLKGVPSPPLMRRAVVAPNAAYGIGQKLCSDYQAAQQTQQPLEPYLDWIEGFLTARAAENPVAAHLLARDNLRREFLVLCQAHPEQSIAEAALALSEQLMSQPLR